MYDNLTEEEKKNVLTHTLQIVLGANATKQFIVNKFKAEFEKQCKIVAAAKKTKKNIKEYKNLTTLEKKKKIAEMKKRSKIFKDIYIYYQHTNMSCRAIAKKLNVNVSTVSRILKKIQELKIE